MAELPTFGNARKKEEYGRNQGGKSTIWNVHYQLVRAQLCNKVHGDK